MNAFVNFIMGPMFWCSILICLLGLAAKTVLIIKQVKEKETFILEYVTLKGSLRSILAWLTPFLPASARQVPIFYAVSYIFHICLFVAPLFLSAHIMVVSESIGVSWISINNTAADVMTFIVVVALIFFVLRRITQPEIKYLTTTSDYLLLILVCLPFLTGFLAYHQLFAYPQMLIAHIVTGEIMLILLPFSRLSHMIIAPLTRGYIGSEFANVRRARDW